jgi:hypothetical protein
MNSKGGVQGYGYCGSDPDGDGNGGGERDSCYQVIPTSIEDR